MASSSVTSDKPRAARAHDGDGRSDARPELEALRALPHERLEAVDDVAARGAGGRDERRLAVGAVGEVDDGLPALRLDEQLVAHGRRVDDEVAAVGVGRPVAVREKNARTSPGSAGSERRSARRRRRSRRRASASMPGEDLLVGVEAEHASVAEDERVHGLAVGLVAERRRRPACAGW